MKRRTEQSNSLHYQSVQVISLLLVFFFHAAATCNSINSFPNNVLQLYSYGVLLNAIPLYTYYREQVSIGQYFSLQATLAAHWQTFDVFPSSGARIPTTNILAIT